MASVSGTSSIGNTSLRGFGGMVSGIDRDSLIEQMTMGTQNKIDKKQSDMTKLEWKQEAYRAISDKILDLADNYFSYSSGSNLQSLNFFAKNIISATGDSDYTKFVSASGSSDMLDYLSILGVKQLASSSVRKSDAKGTGELETKLGDLSQEMSSSNLAGTQLKFGTWNATKKGFDNQATFTMPTTYEDENGEKKEINYYYDPSSGQSKEEFYTELTDNLNKALEQSGAKSGDKKLYDVLEFEYDSANDRIGFKIKDSSVDIRVRDTSSALAGMGYDKDANKGNFDEGIKLSDFNDPTKVIRNKGFSEAAVTTPKSAAEYMTGKKLTFNYNGSKKEIELITEEEYQELMQLPEDERLAKMKENLQGRLDKAFGKTADGTSKVQVTEGQNGNLAFTTDESSSVSITSKDDDLLANLGIKSGSTNKVNTGSTLDKANIKGLNNLDQFRKKDENGNLTNELDLKINGVSIEGLTTDSTVDQILSKINKTTAAGVKASYVSSTNQFVLVSSDTGAGRDIDISASGGGSALSEALFGHANLGDPTEDEKYFTEGQDAIISVSYGNGMTVEMNRSSNTFDLEGLEVTVTGTFGYKKDADGNVTDELDSSQAVSFSGTADVDGVTESVKKFIEEYNALITEINTQVTTKYDRSYGPLTDAQKEEMTEKEIEQWEEKAKQGMLFSDSTIMQLSSDMQNSVLSFIKDSGISLQDLEEIGITISDDYSDGGQLVFDEAAFKQAMTEDPENVGNIFAGGGDVKVGLAKSIENTLNPYATRYATRNGNSYGRLIEEAGSTKVPLSVSDNYIYNQLKTMKDDIATLRERLATEQDRYIREFSSMETLISNMNSQSSWLSQLQ